MTNPIDEARRELELAVEQQKRCLLPRANDDESRRAWATENARLAQMEANARRRLAELAEEEHVVPFDIGVEPEAAVSGEFILRDPYFTFVTFNAMRTGPDGLRETAGTAVLHFRGVAADQSGLPNDEALDGHPLAAVGLDAYGVFEVLNSTWAKRAEAQNRAAFPYAAPWSVTHFVITFHDSIYECLAGSVEVEVTTQPHEEVFRELYRRMSEYGSQDWTRLD